LIPNPNTYVVTSTKPLFSVQTDGGEREGKREKGEKKEEKERRKEKGKTLSLTLIPTVYAMLLEPPYN
jgi:hypothetical protein